MSDNAALERVACFIAGMFLNVLAFVGIMGGPIWLIIVGLGAIIRGDNEMRWPW